MAPTTTPVEVTLEAPHIPGAVVYFALGLMFSIGSIAMAIDNPWSLTTLAALAITSLTVGSQVFRTRIRSRRLTLGPDGIRIEHMLGRTRFFPWSEVVGLKKGAAHRLFLVTTRGKFLLGTDVMGAGPAVDEERSYGSGADLRAWIESARERFQAAKPRTRDLLADVPERKWVKTLERALSSADYRTFNPRSMMIADLLDPGTPPDIRTAIAKAVRPRADEREVFSSIARSSASVRVRVAIEEQLKAPQPHELEESTDKRTS